MVMTPAASMRSWRTRVVRRDLYAVGKALGRVVKACRGVRRCQRAVGSHGVVVGSELVELGCSSVDGGAGGRAR